MSKLIKFLKWILTPRLTDSEKRLIEVLNREHPKLMVIGNGTFIRIVTEEDNDRFNQMAKELAHLVENGERHLCANRRGREDQ